MFFRLFCDGLATRAGCPDRQKLDGDPRPPPQAGNQDRPTDPKPETF